MIKGFVLDNYPKTSKQANRLLYELPNPKNKEGEEIPKEPVDSFEANKAVAKVNHKAFPDVVFHLK